MVKYCLLSGFCLTGDVNTQIVGLATFTCQLVQSLKQNYRQKINYAVRLISSYKESLVPNTQISMVS